MPGTTGRKRTRGADATRRALLDAAFAEIYRHGFQAASVADILKNTRVTKGAFFHHFPTKKALGYAVVDEVIAAMIRAQWVEPLARSGDALATILDEFRKGIDLLEAAPVNLGCPLNNLAQEMSPIDRGFQRRTQKVFDAWVGCFARALERERAAGRIRRSVDANETALYLVSQIEGLLSLSKNAQSTRVLRTGWRAMKGFFATLAP
jgi:TetR/AcrR family transcriptional regulator, transcriptional repressor for nem operon